MQTFQEVAPGIGTGCAPTAAWQPIADCPLVIFVGVTGVGKSTTIDALARHLTFQLLPNRRVLTDDLIIAYLQRQAGQPVSSVTDRAERFAFTRRYREQFPGGMGHALSQLVIELKPAPPAMETAPQQWYIFDGLRGVNEVSAAATELLAARFVVLDAPDLVRVQRLLGRGDSFDHVTLAQHQTTPEQGGTNSFADINLPEADALFTPEEAVILLSTCTPPVGQGNIPVDDLRAKLKIVTEERRSYDPRATLHTLQELAPDRTLVIDTTRVRAKQAAQNIAAWLQS